ncbi:MAG: phosphopyruvate hydratase [Desulfovibrio sp.]|jgi:enolase|nr:phosphopyruvate hydratase [Desulfovibrio sp.]
MKDAIRRITAREILGGAGRPTVEVTLTLDCDLAVSASAPSGTSRGKYEAFELFDREERFGGYGVRKAAALIRERIAPALAGMSVLDLAAVDGRLLELDGTRDKSRLGSNAILPVSVAAAKAAALAAGLPLYRYLGGQAATRLPVPIATVIAGGPHSPSGLAFEDFLYIVQGFSSFEEALEALAATRGRLGAILAARFGPVAEVGGALAPPLGDTREAFDFMLQAARETGCEGKMGLALDVAASGLYDEKTRTYALDGRQLEAGDLCRSYLDLVRSYPLLSIEDPFQEDDFASHAELRAKLDALRSPCAVVGDDLFATNPERLARGLAARAATELLLKINQIGTVSEALQVGSLARENGLALTVSLRSNETCDSFVADLAVALGAERIKSGSPVRAERNAKYNRLLQINAELASRARFAPPIFYRRLP